MLAVERSRDRMNRKKADVKKEVLITPRGEEPVDGPMEEKEDSWSPKKDQETLEV